MSDFKNLNNDEAKLVIAAMFKGVVHATVIPLLIIIYINGNYEGNFGILGGIFYVIIMWTAYNIWFQNKDISKIAFNYTVGAYIGFFISIIFLGTLLSVA